MDEELEDLDRYGDPPELIQKCLHCTEPVCWNCLETKERPHIYIYEGKELPQVEIAKRAGLHINTLRMRIKIAGIGFGGDVTELAHQEHYARINGNSKPSARAIAPGYQKRGKAYDF